MARAAVANPYRPGAGHMPPYLAGRRAETDEFRKLLGQDVILDNLIVTGLRGVGKTVLLETLKPLAIRAGWAWVGTDLSEATSLTDERIALRLMADLAPVTSSLVVHREEVARVGFRPAVQQIEWTLTYDVMKGIYDDTPGLVADKLKAVLEFAWAKLADAGTRGVLFVYDEAQNLSDHAPRDEFPLSLMLDVFQSVQRKGMRLMLLLAGLPTLFPKLVEARTFAERMFRVVFLDRLAADDSREAITRPLRATGGPLRLTPPAVDAVVEASGGYPYFIQFICRELFDLSLQWPDAALDHDALPLAAIARKLDTDFFAGRWARVTDRQRDLLTVIAHLPGGDREFGVQEVAEQSAAVLANPFSPSHVNQMLAKLGEAGLIYKNRHGKYSFAVPLLGQFIRRQQTDPL